MGIVSSAVAKWEDNYAFAVAAVPAYWVLIMVPQVVKERCLLLEQSFVEANAEPRRAAEQLAGSDSPNAGVVRRAMAAQANSWENFVVYLSLLATAHVGKVAPRVVNAAAAVTLASRAAFTALYLTTAGGPLSIARSLMYNVGMVAAMRVWYASLSNLLK